MRGSRSTSVRVALAGAAVAASLVVGQSSAPTVSAAPGEATPQITKGGSPAATVPGGTITYTINYTCSNNNNTAPVDGCDGAVISDPLPTFTDIYGDVVPVTFVAAPGTTVFPSLTVETNDPDYPQGVLRGQAATWAPGVSGAITVTVRVPEGVVPVGVTTLSNTAFVTDAEKGTGFRQETPPVTTVVTVDPPNWTITKLGPTTNTRMNRDYEWIVSVCGPATSALWPVYDITDTLPPGFQFVGAEHGGFYTDDDGSTPGDSVSDGAGTITWTFDASNPAPLESDGCFRTTITGRFPSPYTDPNPSDPADDDNVGGAHKLNVVGGVGHDDSGNSQSLGPATWESILTAPVFGSAGTDKRFTDEQGGENFYATSGDTGVFNLSASIDSDFPLDYAVLTDGRWDFTNGGPVSGGSGMPTSFTPTQMVPGTWNGDLTAQLQGSADGSTWTDIGSPVASGDPVVSVPAGTRFVRWVWGAPNGDDVVPGNFQAEGQQIVGTLGGGEGFGLYTNYSQFHLERDGTPPQADVEDSDQYILETPNPLARIDKSAANSTRLPGQSTTFSITVRNDADATGTLVNPEVTDCIPQHFNLQGPPTVGAGWTIDPNPAPCQTDGPDGQPHAGTSLHFTYAGTLQPGDVASSISYNVQVSPSDPGPVAPFGNYVNTAFVWDAGLNPFEHCGNTNPVCGDPATVTVPPTVELASQKCVSGVLDGGTFRPNPGCEDATPAQTIAQTLPGNRILWRLELQNVGNTSANNIDFIDVFPHVGDSAIISTTNGQLNQRGSEFTPILTSPITDENGQPPAGWTVYYSTSANPCRPEVGGPTTNCEAPGWTATPDPLLLPTYRSIKLHYDEVLEFGESAQFTWEMRAPVTDSTYDVNGNEDPNLYEFLDDADGNCGAYVPATDPTHCPRAVNSFAYGADATGIGNIPPPGRLYAEPPQVEVRVSDPPPGHAIGDRVWSDRDFDGVQSGNLTDEPGIPGIFVELLDAGGNVIDSTFTDANGNYLFSGADGLGLADGQYSVRFHKPAGWWVSPQDRSGLPGDQDAANTDDDSDVPQAGAATGTPGVTTHDTALVTLGTGGSTTEMDLTWDMGLWEPLPTIGVVKVTKDTAWPDNAAADGVTILRGRPVTWIYTVTNTGNTRLENVTLTDDGGPDADFTVSDCAITNQGANADGLTSSATAPMALNRGATMTCSATGTAQATNYSNNATVVGTVVTDDGTPAGPGPGDPPSPPTVTDTDPSNYISGKYDLALAKTVGTLNLATGNVTFTVTVRNEGTVGSGDYVVTDVLPSGVSHVTSNPAATVDGSTLTWNLTGLAPSTNRTITINAHVDDYLLRPYRNYAEISDDSAELVQTGGVLTPAPNGDWDSDPDADIGNDNSAYGPVGTPNAAVDNANITQAGSVGFPDSGDDTSDGQDDADIADVAPAIDYDLALAKVAAADTVPFGTNPSFTVRVYNQGNVPSGAVVVRDQLPDGLSFTSTGSTAGCALDAGNDTQVLCPIANVQPGAFTDLTINTTIDLTNGVADYSTAPWRNWAEIDSDSAQELYAVTDDDSTPEGDNANGIGGPDDTTLPGDVYAGVATNATTYPDPTPGDEDDNDDALVSTGVAYDLALAKTAAAPDVAAGTVQYTITVANQGTVDSGTYTVTDLLPAGTALRPGSATPAPVDPGVNPLTWDMPNLAPGAETQIVYTADITDFTVHDLRNVAEISADQAQELYNLPDRDSVPNTVTGDDGDYDAAGVDNTGPDAIDQAGVAPDPSDDADVADVHLDITYDLALAKVATVTTIGLGESPTFTISVYNQGNVQSDEVVVRDQLPTGLSFDVVGSDSRCATASGNQVLCAIDNIASGGSTTLTIATTIDGTPDNFGTAPWQNWAEIDSDSAQETYDVTDVDSQPEGDGDPPNGIGIDDTPPGDAYVDVPAAGPTYSGPQSGDEDDNDDAVVATSVRYDLALAKVADVTDLVQGVSPTITYVITVANQGTVSSGQFTVLDTLPAGVTFTSADGGGVNIGNTVTWTIANLEPGASLTLELEATITDLTARPYRNYAEITDDSAAELYGVDDPDSDPDADTHNDNPGASPADDGYGPVGDSNPAVDNLGISDAGEGDDGDDDADVADIDLPLTGAYDLALAKTADQAVIDHDGTITYTITVENQGLVDSQEFTVTDWVPAGLTPSNASDGGLIAADGTTITWTIADLAPGQSVTRTFEATIADITLRPYRNVAEITDDSADYYTIDGETVTDDDSVPDGDPTNDGDYDTAGVDNTGPDAIDQAGVQPDPSDDADIADVAVDVRYDLALIKLGPATLDPSGEATFTIVVANQGNVASGPYTVTDEIPAGMAFDSASDGAAPGGDGVRWTDLPSLAPGQQKQLTVTFTITDYSQRPFLNVAEITSDSSELYDSAGGVVVDDGDSTPNDDPTNEHDATELIPDDPAEEAYDDEDIAVLDAPVLYDMELAKTVDQSTIAPDGTATFTITVFNNGNVPSGPVTVVDALPAGLAAGAISDGGMLDADGTITWVAEVPAQQTKTLTVQVAISDITKRPFRNVADITADGADLYDVDGQDVEDEDSVPADPESSGADNTSITEAGDGADDGFDDEDPAVLDADVVYDLALIKRLPGGQRFKLGDVIRFEVVVANQGNVPSGAYTVQDVLPAGLSFVAASDGGAGAAGVVTWAGLPSLAPGEQKVLTVEVRMDDVTQPSYVNVAEITDDSSETYAAAGQPVTDRDSGPDGDPGNDPYADTDDVNAPIDGDEDDQDRALIDPAQVAVDNQAPPPPAQPTAPPTTVPDPGELPRTGGNSAGTVWLAGSLLALGLVLVGIRRRRVRRG